MVIGGIIMLTFVALLPTAANFWLLLMMYCVMAAGVAFAMPAATAFVVEEGRTFGMGATMAAFMMAMTIGNVVGPIMLGVVVDAPGIESAFYSGQVLSLICIALFTWFTRHYAQHQQNETNASS